MSASMNWVPMTDFENEVVSLQPHHDFIFGTMSSAEPDVFYPRPESHLLYLHEKKRRNKAQSSNNNAKLSIISKVQQIAGTKPLGEQATVNDWDNNDNVERETIAMMRHLGLNPSIEEPLKEHCTIATRPIQEEMLVMKNGRKRLPIFYDDKYFKLKPRVSCSFLDEEDMEIKYNSEDKETEKVPNPSNAVDTIESSGKCKKLANDTLFKRHHAGNSRTLDGNESSDNEIFHIDFIPSISWTRSVHHANRGKRITKANHKLSSSAYGQRRHESPDKRAQCFYTAKELYEKKRKHLSHFQ